jgi:hypothetical protein
MDALYIPALNDLAAQAFGMYNYKSPANNTMTLEGANLYGLAGITPDGVSTYADTHFNPATQGVNYLLNTASRGLWVYTAATVGTSIEGHAASTGNRMINASSSNHRINTSSNLSATVAFQGTGYRAINRSTSTDCQLYVGQTANARTATSTGINSSNLVIGRSDTAFANAVISMYYIGGNLTATMHNNIGIDFQTYLTEIGL